MSTASAPTTVQAPATSHGRPDGESAAQTLDRLANDADRRAEQHERDGFPAHAEVARYRARVLRQAQQDIDRGVPVRYELEPAPACDCGADTAPRGRRSHADACAIETWTGLPLMARQRVAAPNVDPAAQAEDRHLSGV